MRGRLTNRTAVVSPSVMPSGEQIDLGYGDHHAVVVEVGGGLRTYSYRGIDVIDGYAEAEACSSGRGQILAPWPNRIEDGVYDFGGEHYQLPITEVSSSTAIHGLVRWMPWIVEEPTASRARLSCTLYPQPGYPFLLAMSTEYELSEAGLSVKMTATNLGDSAFPFGAGAHPYLRLGNRTVGSLTLSCPAATYLVSNERGLPVDKRSVEGTTNDFRHEREIGSLQLDHAFGDLERDAAGRAHITLRDPASGRAVAVWMDEHHPYAMIFTGDPLPDVRRRSIAIEPMTCPPNAFRSGDDLIVLRPGETFAAGWGIEPKF